MYTPAEKQWRLRENFASLPHIATWLRYKQTQMRHKRSGALHWHSNSNAPALHPQITITPICYHLHHLLQNIGSHFSTLPPSHYLYHIKTPTHPLTLLPYFQCPDPLLPYIVEIKTAPSLMYTPCHPSLMDWSNKCMTLKLYSHIHK